MASRPNFNRLVRSIEDRYQEWRLRHEKPPEILYHYSRAAGMHGILESGVLWATNSRFTNDPSEMAYACALARAILEDDCRRALLGVPRLRELLMSELEEMESSARVYIACFCQRGDLLSQWRGYGADGGGYSIGLAAGELQQLNPWPKTLVILNRVIYDPKEQRRILRGFVEAACEAAARSEGLRERNDRDTGLDWIFLTLHQCLAEWLNCVKAPAYREEEEWRLIAYGRVARKQVLAPSFRTTDSHVIPYVAIPIGKKGKGAARIPIREVRFGPTLEPNLTERSLKLFLEHCGYDLRRVKISQSGVPFRG